MFSALLLLLLAMIRVLEAEKHGDGCASLEKEEERRGVVQVGCQLYVVIHVVPRQSNQKHEPFASHGRVRI